MKHALLLLLVVLSSIDRITDLEDVILGEWTITGFKSGSTLTLCNDCPRIEFETNTNATLYSSSNAEQYYFWTLKDSILSLEKNGTEEGYQYFFREQSYSYKLSEHKKGYELVLTDVEGQGIVLRKIKTNANKK
jgi:hypothetical protein